MKILIYGINFHPEIIGTGRYTGDMACWLAEKGHQVRVLTTKPYYPEWRVRDGYSARTFTKELWAGVEVLRSPIWVPRDPSSIKRILHLLSFALSSLPGLITSIFWKPDVIFVVEPTFFCAPAALFAARLSGAKAWLHIQDFEIDAAFELGFLQSALFRGAVTAVENKIMSKFDMISTISNRMLERIHSKGVPDQKAIIFKNWVDLSKIEKTSSEDNNYFREHLGLSKTSIVALYSGTMGAKQGISILAQVAKMCPTVQFIFCGDGPGRAELEAASERLKNVTFLNLQPTNLLSQLLAAADIHLLPQRADAADLVMPSKLTGMLASGRPVVATAQPGTEIADVITECGILAVPENAESVAAAIKVLENDPLLRSAYQLAARQYAENNLDRILVLTRIEHQIQKLSKTQR